MCSREVAQEEEKINSPTREVPLTANAKRKKSGLAENRAERHYSFSWSRRKSGVIPPPLPSSVEKKSSRKWPRNDRRRESTELFFARNRKINPEQKR